jgi:hypothetical protein
VPPACLHNGKLQVGPHGCHDALERELRARRSCRLVAFLPGELGTSSTGAYVVSRP